MVNGYHPGCEPIPGYTLKRYIGRGGFGEVWEAEAPGGLAKAVKIAPMDHAEAAFNCRELEGLRKMRTIRHPYLLSIERFEIVENSLVIVMELADKNLAERYAECGASGLPGVPRDELLAYLHEAAEVLDLMSERHGLQHLDVKPENLFLCGGHVKVADFGLVQPRNTNMSRSALAISPPYAPPELFDGRVEPTADQYSLAVTYQELLTGTRPYAASDVRSLVLAHLRGRPDVSALPPGDRPILARALQRDASARFSSCSEFFEALKRASAFGVPVVETIPRTIDLSAPTIKVTQAAATPPPVAPLFTRNSKKKVIEPAVETTQRFAARTAPVDTGWIRPASTEAAAEGDPTRSTFIAFLPLEIFAFKLRGFIDALGAEIVSCTDERTVLRLGSRRWFGLRSANGLFLEMYTYARNPESGYRVVDVCVWSTRKDETPLEMSRRSMLLIRALKAYLMATDSKAPVLALSEARLRQEILN